MKNLYGKIGNVDSIIAYISSKGIININLVNGGKMTFVGGYGASSFEINTKNQMNEYPDDIVVINRLMRIYKRIA